MRMFLGTSAITEIDFIMFSREHEVGRERRARLLANPPPQKKNDHHERKTRAHLAHIMRHPLPLAYLRPYHPLVVPRAPQLT